MYFDLQPTSKKQSLKSPAPSTTSPYVRERTNEAQSADTKTVGSSSPSANVDCLDRRQSSKTEAVSQALGQTNVCIISQSKSNKLKPVAVNKSSESSNLHQLGNTTPKVSSSANPASNSLLCKSQSLPSKVMTPAATEQFQQIQLSKTAIEPTASQLSNQSCLTKTVNQLKSKTGDSIINQSKNKLAAVNKSSESNQHQSGNATPKVSSSPNVVVMQSQLSSTQLLSSEALLRKHIQHALSSKTALTVLNQGPTISQTAMTQEPATGQTVVGNQNPTAIQLCNQSCSSKTVNQAASNASRVSTTDVEQAEKSSLKVVSVEQAQKSPTGSNSVLIPPEYDMINSQKTKHKVFKKVKPCQSGEENPASSCSGDYIIKPAIINKSSESNQHQLGNTPPKASSAVNIIDVSLLTGKTKLLPSEILQIQLPVTGQTAMTVLNQKVPSSNTGTVFKVTKLESGRILLSKAIPSFMSSENQKNDSINSQETNLKAAQLVKPSDVSVKNGRVATKNEAIRKTGQQQERVDNIHVSNKIFSSQTDSTLSGVSLGNNRKKLNAQEVTPQVLGIIKQPGQSGTTSTASNLSSTVLNNRKELIVEEAKQKALEVLQNGVLSQRKPTVSNTSVATNKSRQQDTARDKGDIELHKLLGLSQKNSPATNTIAANKRNLSSQKDTQKVHQIVRQSEISQTKSTALSKWNVSAAPSNNKMSAAELAKQKALERLTNPGFSQGKTTGSNTSVANNKSRQQHTARDKGDIELDKLLRLSQKNMSVANNIAANKRCLSAQKDTPKAHQIVRQSDIRQAKSTACKWNVSAAPSNNKMSAAELAKQKALELLTNPGLSQRMPTVSNTSVATNKSRKQQEARDKLHIELDELFGLSPKNSPASNSIKASNRKGLTAQKDAPKAPELARQSETSLVKSRTSTWKVSAAPSNKRLMPRPTAKNVAIKQAENTRTNQANPTVSNKRRPVKRKKPEEEESFDDFMENLLKEMDKHILTASNASPENKRRKLTAVKAKPKSLQQGKDPRLSQTNPVLAVHNTNEGKQKGRLSMQQERQKALPQSGLQQTKFAGSNTGVAISSNRTTLNAKKAKHVVPQPGPIKNQLASAVSISGVANIKEKLIAPKTAQIVPQVRPSGTNPRKNQTKLTATSTSQAKNERLNAQAGRVTAYQFGVKQSNPCQTNSTASSANAAVKANRRPLKQDACVSVKQSYGSSQSASASSSMQTVPAENDENNKALLSSKAAPTKSSTEEAQHEDERSISRANKVSYSEK